MAEKKSVKFNYLMNMLLTASNIIFPFITFPYVSRILMPDGLGKISFAQSCVSYFTMFAMLGIPTYGIRLCAKVRNDKEQLSKAVQELFILNSMAGIVAYLALAVSIFVIPEFRAERALFWVNSFTVLFNVIGVEWLYKALEEYSYITVRSLAFKVLSIVLMFALVHTKEDYVIYGAIAIIANVCSYGFNFLHLRKVVPIIRPAKYEFKKHWGPILTFFMVTCATTIYTSLDSVMLGFMSTDAMVGYYNAAVKMKKVLVTMVTAFGAVLLPRVSFYYQNKMFDDFRNIARKAFNYVIVVAFPISMYFMLMAQESILFLSGDAYKPAIIPMMIIMPTVFLIGLSNLTGMQILVPQGKERVVLVSVICGAVLDATINYIYIPKIGAAGASLGTTLAELLVLAVQVVALKDVIGQYLKGIQFGKIGAANIIATVVTYGAKYVVARTLTTNAFILLSTTAVVFALTYFFVLLLTKERFTQDYLWGFLKKKLLIKR